MTFSTVCSTLTSHNKPSQFACQPSIRPSSSCILPTAVTVSPRAKALRTILRPRWPVAPKTTQLRGLTGALELVGGSQDRGRRAVDSWLWGWEGELGEEEMGVE